MTSSRADSATPTCVHTDAERRMDPFLGGWGHGCQHKGHKPCRDRSCFFIGMDHCHEKAAR